MTNRNRKYPELYDPKQLKQLMDECGTGKAVARKLGCDAKTVWRACRLMGMDIIHSYPELRNPEALRALQEKYITDAGIAHQLGCTKQAVWYARKALGILPLTHQRCPVLWNQAAFMKLNPNGRSTADIAAELGCSPHAAWEACVRFGVPRPKGKEINPVLRHPDVLAHLMKRYNSDTHVVADIIGARYEIVRDYITNYRRKGYLI